MSCLLATLLFPSPLHVPELGSLSPPLPGLQHSQGLLTTGDLVLALGAVRGTITHLGDIHAQAVVADEKPRAWRDLRGPCPRKEGMSMLAQRGRVSATRLEANMCCV